MLRRFYARLVFYPTLGWNYLLGRVIGVRNWWDLVDSHVIVGAYPFASLVPEMHADGVRAVVNTCEEYSGPVDQYERHGIEQLRIQTTDFTHPKLEDIHRAVGFTQQHVDAGRVVYIHCKAGRARSATVALCWLMKYRGMTMDEGQAALLAARPHVNSRLTERAVVREFANSIES